uniref:Uncharacterized protein n=1 Tax=Mycena chlorophos TaxID=658473 RepID=A0ABQ0KWD3_MYCCL|nr:predicted protein [Mycena chlorophos]
MVMVDEGDIMSPSVVQAFAEEVEDADTGELVEPAVQEPGQEQLEADEDTIVGAPIISEPERVVEYAHEHAVVVERGLASKSESATIEVVLHGKHIDSGFGEGQGDGHDIERFVLHWLECWGGHGFGTRCIASSLQWTLTSRARRG